ncbi:polyhydroxyalkanoate synthesis regulator [candidate division KSB1 bacterium]|nr:polyhydroxyalkanoate synthesis regulator [candidate division KSB1 bacterium]
MIDLLKKTLFFGIGAAEMTKDKVETLVDELIKKGEVAKDQRAKTVQDFLGRVEKSEKALMKKIEIEVEKAITKMHIATQKDVEKLEKRIASLEKK